MGSVIIVGLLVLIQWLTSQLMLRKNDSDWYYLSYLPAVGAWAFLCDENNMLAGVISLLVVMLSAKGCLCIRHTILRWGYILLLTPYIYWIAGGLHWLFVILAVTYELFVWKHRSLLCRFIVCL